MIHSELLRIRYSLFAKAMLALAVIEAAFVGLLIALLPGILNGLIALNEVIPNATEAGKLSDEQLSALSLASPGAQQIVLDILSNGGFGASLPVVLALLFGALTITTEYRRGSIATAALAEPRRLRLLASKLAALVSLVLGAAIVLAAVRTLVLGFGLGVAGQPLLLDPAEVFGGWLRGALALVLYAAIGFAVGLLVRSPVAAILAVGAAILVETVLRPVALLIFGAPNPLQYLPIGLAPDISGTNPLAAMSGADAPLLAVLPAGSALLTLFCWALVLVAVAAVRFRRSDIPALV